MSYNYCVLLSCVLLTACGGGGSGPSSSSTPPSLTQPTNQAPIIQLGQTSITLEEGQSGSVSLSISDSDSDSFSVEIDTDLEGVTYDESQGRLNIDAQMVDADLSDSVTITATDNEGASNSATLTVNITNSSNAPPTVSWVGFQEEPDFIVRERTTLRLPFEVQDADNDSFDYNIEFSLVSGQGSADIEINGSVDEENGQLIIQPQSLPSIFSIGFRGTFTVSDGVNTDSETFLIEIFPNQVSLNISLRSVLIIEGESQQIPFTITANDIDLFEFTEVDYVNEQDAIDDPLDFFIDKDARLFNISAENGFANRTVNLRIRYQENDNASFSRVLPVTIRSELTDNELALMSRLDNYLTLVNQTNDYEFITRYALDILFARGELTKAEYLDLVDQNNDIRAVNIAFARLTHSNVLDNLTSSTLYTDTEQYLIAVEQLDKWLNNVKVFRGNNVPFTNEILDKLGWENLGSELSVEITPSLLSRFIGNSNYGSYINEEWVFDEEYQYLEAPLGLLTNENF